MIRYVRFLSLVTMLVMVLTACGAGGTPSTQTTKPAEPTKAAVSTPAGDATTGTMTNTTEMTTTESITSTTSVSPTTEVSTTNAPLPDLGGRKLVIGSDTTYPPMEYVDEQTKEITGFDVDLLKEIGKLINVQIEFKTFPNFDAIFAALANKEFDLVVSSVSVTEERRKIIDFSDPYLNIGQVIAVQKSNTTITGQADLAKVQLVGVQGGTTGEQATKKAGVDEAKIKRYDTIDLAFQDLSIGAIDAVVADGPPSARYATQLKDKVKIVGGPFTTEEYAIALQQGDTQLKDAVNAALKELKANGKLQELVNKWNLQDVATLP